MMQRLLNSTYYNFFHRISRFFDNFLEFIQTLSEEKPWESRGKTLRFPRFFLLADFFLRFFQFFENFFSLRKDAEKPYFVPRSSNKVRSKGFCSQCNLKKKKKFRDYFEPAQSAHNSISACTLDYSHFMLKRRILGAVTIRHPELRQEISRKKVSPTRKFFFGKSAWYQLSIPPKYIATRHSS